MYQLSKTNETIEGGDVQSSGNGVAGRQICVRHAKTGSDDDDISTITPLACVFAE